MEVMELLTQAVEQNAADIFLVPGMPFSYKIGGRIICQYWRPPGCEQCGSGAGRWC